MVRKNRFRHRNNRNRLKYKGVVKIEPKIMTIDEMYGLYPRKWLLVNNPVHRERDYRIISGELLGVFDARADAYKEGGRREFRRLAIINSIQEEL